MRREIILAPEAEIVITRHGKAAGVLIGFESEDDWFDYRLENDPRFLNRIAAARASLSAGRGVRLADLAETPASNPDAPPARAQRPGRTKRAASRTGRGR